MNTHGGMMMNSQHPTGNQNSGAPRMNPLGVNGLGMGVAAPVGGGFPGGPGPPNYGGGGNMNRGPPMPQFDMSDFPALGSLHNGMGSSEDSADGGKGSMQQQYTPHGSTMSGHIAGPHPGVGGGSRQEFAIHNEDFPALSSAKPPSNASNNSHIQGSHLDPGLSGPSTSALTNSIGEMQGGSNNNSTGSSIDGDSSGSARASNSASPWGMTGLLSVIRMTDPDLNTLALGTDLTTLGLNLNSTEVLYATFSYPCVENPCRREPDYVLPYCYYMQPPALKTSHLSKFQLETLFYIFYNMPKDTLQVYAAKELYNRDWRYHKELKLWFARDTSQGGGQQPAGSYIYFDINSWERRLFRDPNIPGGLKFMTEEEHGLL